MITLQKKQALIDSAKQHQKLDEYQTGIYFKNGRGNAVGCAIEDINRLENLNINHYNHKALAEYLDIPVYLTKMQDSIFERCTDDYRKNWPIKFLEAIPTDRTISDLIVPKFLLFALQDIDCPDIKAILTNWLETGELDKDAVCTAYTGYTACDVICAACVILYDTAHAAYTATNKAKAYNSYGEELLRLMGETL